MSSEQIDEKQLLKDDPVNALRKMQQNILTKMQVLEGLNIDFKNKQEKQFLKTFMNIMDKMSTELMIAKQKYRNIDKQIQRDEKCVKLTKQLKFFKDECVVLKHQLDEAQNQLEEERRINQQLQRERDQLNKGLMKKSKQALRYRSRLMSLQKRQTLKNSQITSQFEQLSSQKFKINFHGKRTALDNKSSLKKTWHSFNIKNNLHSSEKKSCEKEQHSAILSKKR